MKNVIEKIITLILIWIFCMTAAVYGQTVEVTFYFPVSSATLSVEQTDSIETIMKSGFEPVSVVGYANTYSNIETDETNESLAARRSQVFGAPVTTSHVVIAGEAEMRKVVILFALNTTSVSTDVQLSSDNVRQDESGSTSNDNIETNDNTVSHDNNLVDSLLGVVSAQRANRNRANMLSNEVSDSAAHAAYLDSLYANATEYEKAAWAMNVETKSQDDAKSCGCGVDQSIEKTWALYESLQDSSQANVHINNTLSKEFTCQATQVRICWESMYKAYKAQSRTANANKAKKTPSVDNTKTSAKVKVKSTAYSQSGKVGKPLGERIANAIDSALDWVFPFRNC